MTRDRGTPNRRPTNPSNKGNKGKGKAPRQPSRNPRHADGENRPLPPPPRKSAHYSPADRPVMHSRRSQPSRSPQIPLSEFATPQDTPPLSNSTLHPIPQRRQRLWRSPLPKSWQFWAISSVAVFVGISGVSLALLLKLPGLPNCPAIFWPTASASLRLYCAQVAANRQTADDLLKAIALVDSLPSTHPLRPEINRHIEDWSLAILALGEQTFQAGDLQGAIDTAQRIPQTTPAYQQVSDRIERWEGIWSRAEGIYQEAEAALRQQDFPKAFRIAVRLLEVGNTHWATTRYEELNQLIASARDDGSKLTRARNLMNRGGLTNLLEAVKLAEEVKPESYVYQGAEELIAELGQAMMSLAEVTLEQQDHNGALEIVRQIPKRANLQAEARDFETIAQAQAVAWRGTVADLEVAVVQAQQMASDRPLYGRAQELIGRWRLEIQDLTRLTLARQLAQPGTVSDLSAAIAEAQLIPASNPRAAEAREEIARWRTQVETMEDRPFLDQAEALASAGDIFSLQAAIDQASRIQQGRALYSDARRQIQTWQSRMERMQDQPYLDQATQLANMGNLSGAIAAAEQISSGRTLYDDAQTNIRSWRAQLQGQQRMQEAYSAARFGTPPNLITAIRAADQVAAESPLRAEANRMINIWSQDLLRFARTQATVDLEGAIATASNIPPRTEAYAAAQQQIQVWRETITSIRAPIPPAPPLPQGVTRPE